MPEPQDSVYPPVQQDFDPRRNAPPHQPQFHAAPAVPAAPAAPAQAEHTPVDPKAAQDKIWALGKKQSEERRALAKKHADGKRSLKSGDGKQTADVATTNAKEEAELREKQAKEAADAKLGVLPDFNGYDLQEKAAALHADLSAVAAEHHFEVGELRNFGLEFDVFDPMTGMVMSPARAHRRDVGDAGQLMTVDGVLSDIASARAHQKTAGVTQYSADNRIA